MRARSLSGVALGIVVAAIVGGCASVLGLDSGDPRAALEDGSAPDALVDAPASDGPLNADGGCGRGTKSCGGSCVSATDPSYGCGGATCTGCSTPFGTPGCVNGACAVATCDPGRGDCDLDPSNGCETDVTNDRNNCSTCGKACTELYCDKSQCTNSCTGTVCPPKATCVDTMNDPANCNGCGNVCPGGAVGDNATPHCTSGKCTITCAAPYYADCDGNAANGCEVDLRQDARHCGSCLKDCTLLAPPPNMTGPTCTMSACAWTSCVAGYSDCDQQPANGCECNGGCAGTACLSTSSDSGTIDASPCTVNAPTCQLGGTACAVVGPDATCCGCTCVAGPSGNECCRQSGDTCMNNQECCSGTCSPTAMIDGAAIMGNCN